MLAAPLRAITRLPRACRDAIIAYGARTTWPAGFVVYERDTPADGVFVVVRGQIVLRNQLAPGRLFVPWIATPGETFGDEGLQDDFRYVSTARAEEESETLHIRSARFSALLREQPPVALALMRQMISERTALLQKQGEHSTLSVEERVVITLVRLACSPENHRNAEPTGPRAASARAAHDIGNGKPRAISRRLLGELVGATRESISMVIARLTTEALVSREGSGLVITDLDGLVRRLQGSDRAASVEVHEEGPSRELYG